MKRWNRRGFLGQAKRLGLGAVAGWTILNDARSVRATPANDKIAMAIVGCAGRGNALARGFASRGDCQITCVADVNTAMFERHAPGIAACQDGRMPRFVQDFRRALEDPSLDAIIVATPTHWHALATVWGCQAGKDVFVEKPLAHNAWEGQQMVKAARKYERVVQVGTQNRSAPYNKAARQYIADGKLGKCTSFAC
jgi:predicted dehydrogenase